MTTAPTLLPPLLATQTAQPHEYFYIFDPHMQPIGLKRRYHVHHDGDWHRGVQLNIRYQDEILIQRRSDQVDIAQHLLDQSLATQLILADNDNEKQALIRGLATELGYQAKPRQLRKVAGPRRIIKRYSHHPDLWNREFVSLYELRLPTRHQFTPHSPKVSSVEWWPTAKVLSLWQHNPSAFTQTFSMWLKETQL